ncbi:response regulator transcription factor [Sphingomonas sp. CJ20]
MERKIVVSVVEDDDDLRRIIERFLLSVGMEVSASPDTTGLDAAWLERPPDVIVLDVNLPGENGLTAAARLRSRSTVGIIILTGHERDEDRLLGLSLGADHYFSKPIHLRELESVIRNLARRVGGQRPARSSPSELEPSPNEPQTTAHWCLNLHDWALTAPNGVVVELSASESTFLASLLATEGQAVSRDELNRKLGKPNLDPDNRSLDVLASRVRRRIEDVTGMRLPVRAARGCGYVFTGTSELLATVEESTDAGTRNFRARRSVIQERNAHH